MFTQLSQEVYDFFSASTEFKTVMEHDGKVNIFPIVASEKNKLPLTTYVLGDREPETKDRAQIPITVMFWFDENAYTKCCQFTDEMVGLVESKYNFLSAAIEYNEESLTYSGTIVFNLL
jgi:hypothetical protein